MSALANLFATIDYNTVFLQDDFTNEYLAFQSQEKMEEYLNSITQNDYKIYRYAINDIDGRAVAFIMRKTYHPDKLTQFIIVFQTFTDLELLLNHYDNDFIAKRQRCKMDVNYDC